MIIGMIVPIAGGIVVKRVRTFFQRAIQQVVNRYAVEVSPSVPSLPVVVEQARLEWLDAQRYYNTVSDRDLVDHAVYLMQATEKKYVYLLKQARQEGVTVRPYVSGLNAESKIIL